MGTPAITVTAALTQEAEKSGLAVGTLCLKAETTWGPPTCLEEAAPTELPASDADLSAAVLSLSWLPSGTAGPHVALGRRKGAGPLSKPAGPV